ncbi:MAG: hypothetical protein R2865_15415 [Deinococcales bacterium]
MPMSIPVGIARLGMRIMFTVPWQWGTTSFAVDTDIYGGDIDSYEVLCNLLLSFKEKINMFNSPDEVVAMTLQHIWGMSFVEQLRSLQSSLRCPPSPKTLCQNLYLRRYLRFNGRGEYAMSMYWNGATMRVRAERPSVRYAYPKEGILSWMDNA